MSSHVLQWVASRVWGHSDPPLAGLGLTPAGRQPPKVAGASRYSYSRQNAVGMSTWRISARKLLACSMATSAEPPRLWDKRWPALIELRQVNVGDWLTLTVTVNTGTFVMSKLELFEHVCPGV
jgi:hypothetical protein